MKFWQNSENADILIKARIVDLWVYLPTNILKMNNLIVVEITHGMLHNDLNILQEMALKFVETHHIGSN